MIANGFIQPLLRSEFLMSHNRKLVAIDDNEAVVAVSQAFVDALRDGDPDAVMAAFHVEAVAFGLGDGEWLSGPAHHLHGLIAKVGPAPDIKSRIDVLAITPTTAVVRADIEGDALGADYTDFYTLIKQNGAWKIVTNALHQYDR